MRLLRFLLVSALLTVGLPAAAACNYWHILTFTDGAKGCLTDHPVSRLKSPDLGFNVGEAVPAVGAYVLAMPIAAGKSCPAAAGMFVHALATTASSHSLPPESTRVSDALRRCEAAAGPLTGSDAAGCACEVVVVDGVSRLSKAAFEAVANRAALPAQTDAAQVRPQLPAPAAAATRVPAQPPQARTESALDRMQAGLAALRVPAAAACNYWQVLTFGDGSKGCLTDHPISRLKSPELAHSVADSIAPAGTYVVAMPMAAGKSCPAVAGMFTHTLASTASQHSVPSESVRVSDALRRCEAAVRSSVGVDSSGCTCQVVLMDGVSRLSRSAFEAVASRGVLPAEPGREQVEARIPASPAPASPVAAQGAPARADSQSDRMQADLTALRSQLDALMRERQAGAVTPAGSVAASVPRLTARALVIGNSSYSSFAKLPNPRNDARSIAAKLRSFDIEVDLVVDADRDTLIKALNDYSAKAAGKDVNILFYAGHGVQVEGINYLVPTNMRADGISAGYIKLAGISLNATLNYLPAKTRLVFLDACRDNPASRSLMATRSAGSVGLAPTAAPSGTLIAYATKDGATAEDGTGANSPYSAALLAHLDSPQDISLVLRQVRQTVMRMTGNRQEPWEYGSLVGEQLVLPLMARK